MRAAIAIGFVMILALPVAAGAQAIDIQVRSKVLEGQQKPALILTAALDVKGVSVSLSLNGGPSRVVKVGNLRRGQTREIPLEQPAGKGLWKAEINRVGQADPEGIEFEVVVAREMQLHISRDTVDLAEGRIAFTANQKVARVTVTVLGEGGKTLGDYDLPMQSDANTRTTVNIPPPQGAVTLVRLTAYDPDGFFNGVEMAPFFVDVPHEEVNFDFGKADILPAEEPKLTRTQEKIREALKKVGNEFKAKLYVAGYTDTVGGRDSNQDLSHRRAAAIARWFATHGLDVKVCSQGFGEDALAIVTPDETPEPRNRRSIFVLANQVPPVSKTFPRAAWHCL